MRVNRRRAESALGQKCRFECASAVSAIAPIATESLLAAAHGETGEVEEVDEPTMAGDDTANPAAAVSVITQQ
jgi:hypothetical protein